jgi:transposase
MIKMDFNLTTAIQNTVSVPAFGADKQDKARAASTEQNSAGIYLDLSPLAIEKSKKAQRDQDVDDADLPDNVKRSIKALRDQQEELEKKQQELQKLMSDRTRAEEQKQQQIQLLQDEISSLSLAIADGKKNLLTSMQEQNLTDQQMQTAMAMLN